MDSRAEAYLRSLRLSAVIGGMMVVSMYVMVNVFALACSPPWCTLLIVVWMDRAEQGN